MVDSRLKAQDPRPKTQRGQALLELAVFGSILLMLIGILVNYGLRYNFQQQVMQQAFRKALKSAAKADRDGEPSSTTHILIRDRHVPNPAGPFTVGSIIPVSASASVIRNYHMQDNVPQDYAELPQVTIDSNGQEASFKTAGFRDEYNVAEDAIKKYNEIYGSANVRETGGGECLEYEMNPSTGEEECVRASKNLRIIDSCAGEIVDYNAAVRQCRQIIDRGACQKECERGKFPGSATDCSGICSYTMNVPRYCATQECGLDAECNKGTNHKYNFTKLNQMFDFAIASDKPRGMGLQPDYTQKTRMDEAVLTKTETKSGIQTTDSVNYKDTMQRNVIYNAGLGGDGVSTGAVDVKSYPLNTTTQFITCEKNSTDCLYGYKIVTCSGDDCGQSAGGKTWRTNW